MYNEASTTYKLIVLYMLEKVSFPLTKTQINNFILEHEYANFFNLQSSLSELLETGLISSEIMGDRTYLKITDEGISTLEYFSNKLIPSIKNDINHYILENEFELRNQVSILSNYYKSSTSGDYEAHLIAREKNNTIVDLTLSVPLEEMAATICENWTKKNEEIYQYLMEHLL